MSSAGLSSVKDTVLLLLSSLLACGPTCERTCEKILRCDNLSSERVSVEECQESCSRQQVLYELWEDEVKQEAFDDHKRCLVGSSCDEIADGVCYDEELFIF